MSQEVAPKPKLPSLLVLETEDPLAREVVRSLLEAGYPVLGMGQSEKSLGALKSKTSFQFQKIDLSRQDILRSYLYDIDFVLFLDRNADLIQRMEHTFRSLEHLKSKPPGFLFLSSNEVFSSDDPGENLENSPTSPVTQTGIDYAAAEEIVVNYSIHTQGRACILRIPSVWDPALTDDRLANISRLLRLQKPLSILEEGPFYLQWVQLKTLASAIITLLESHWTGTEILHCYSYSGSLLDSLSEIGELMGSGSQTKDLSTVPQFLRKTIAGSPTLREKIESVMGWGNLDFLRVAPLGMKQSLRLFPEPSLKISTFLNQFPRTKKRR